MNIAAQLAEDAVIHAKHVVIRKVNVADASLRRILVVLYYIHIDKTNTVAILAQGTHWAVANSQAFLLDKMLTLNTGFRTHGLIRILPIVLYKMVGVGYE